MASRRAEDQARGHGQGSGTPGRGHTAADEPHDRYNQDNQYIQQNQYSQHGQYSTQNAGPSQAPLHVLPTPGLPAGQPDPGQQQLLPSLQAFDRTLSQQPSGGPSRVQEHFAGLPPVPPFPSSAQPPNQPGQLEPLVDPKPLVGLNSFWMTPTSIVPHKKMYPPVVVKTQRPLPGTTIEIYLNLLERDLGRNERCEIDDHDTRCAVPQSIDVNTQRTSGQDGVYVSFPEAEFKGDPIIEKFGVGFLVATLVERDTNTNDAQHLKTFDWTILHIGDKRRNWIESPEPEWFAFLQDPRINLDLRFRPAEEGEVFSRRGR